MKLQRTRLALLVMAAVLIGAVAGRAQGGKDDEFKNHLIAPTALASILADAKAAKPVIFNIGPRYNLPGAIEIGPAGDAKTLAAFRAHLAKYKKNRQIVVYCRCCPYQYCPNVRPAVAALEKLGYTNFQVIDMPHDIQTDWVSKGYPVEK